MIDKIILTFQKNSNQVKATDMRRYMKDHFLYFGIKSELRRELSKPFYIVAKQLPKEDLKILIKTLWSQPQRELHYLAQELAFRNLKNKWDKQDIDFLEWLATNNAWWDTIDFIAPKLMGSYFLIYPEQIEKFTHKWLNSNDIWLIRCAILFQLKYKDKTDLELLYKIILQCNQTKEFFINKAIGSHGINATLNK